VAAARACILSPASSTGGNREAYPKIAQWHALPTRSCAEFAVQNYLDNRGVEVFLPHFERLSCWGVRRDRSRILTPLFPGYLFARFSLAQLSIVRCAGGLQRVIGPGDRPIPIDEDIIRNLRIASADPSAVTPSDLTDVTGKPVRVMCGPFAGLIGMAERVTGGGRRLVIRIEALGRACAVELGACDVLRAV